MPCPGRYKLLLFSLFALAYSLFYIFPNFRPLFPPVQLPLLAIDRHVPFIPSTFFIYLSDYALILTVILGIKDLDIFNAFAWRAFGTLFVCGLFFLCFPTTYPRPPYPTTEPGLIDLVLRMMDAVDRPTNCFPSMHVAMTATCTYSVRMLGKRRYFSLILWSIAIFISTLTTKQHYLLDILGGLGVTAGVAVAHWYVFERRGWMARATSFQELKRRVR